MRPFKHPHQPQSHSVELRGWSLCEIIDEAGAGFYRPGQQQRLLFSVKAGQGDYIKEICSPEGLVFNPARI